MSKKNRFPGGDEYTSRSIRYPLIISEFENLLGQILTVIDASISEPVQNKAIKDLVRQRFSDKMHGTFWDYCYRKEAFLGDPFIRFNVLEGTVKHSEAVYSSGANSTTPSVSYSQ